MLKDSYIMETLRSLAKEFSGDRKTKVAAGTYIDGILNFGVNHLAYELPEEEIVNRTGLFYATMVHAEIDLATKVQGKLVGKTVYVTLFPCDNCARRLVQEGVTHIIAGEDRPTASYIIAAKEVLAANNVTWEII